MQITDVYKWFLPKTQALSIFKLADLVSVLSWCLFICWFFFSILNFPNFKFWDCCLDQTESLKWKYKGLFCGTLCLFCWATWWQQSLAACLVLSNQQSDLQKITADVFDRPLWILAHVRYLSSELSFVPTNRPSALIFEARVIVCAVHCCAARLSNQVKKHSQLKGDVWLYRDHSQTRNYFYQNPTENDNQSINNYIESWLVIYGHFFSWKYQIFPLSLGFPLNM